MSPNLSAISQRMIISARIKKDLKIFENDFELLLFSVFNSNFII
tara:strand:+ start:3707 stop:3838 length:132 start_codon:yes stop_codon:yes gene_type:complete